MINKLFFSTVDYDWTGHDSKLLDYKNFKKEILNPDLQDYHTSIDDIRIQNIQKVCESAAEIVVVNMSIYHMCNFDSDNTSMNYAYNRLLYTLNNLSSKVVGLDGFLKDVNLQKFNKLTNTRHTNSQVLWTAGCSFTYGVGVEQTQRWAHHLSNQLNLPEITLSMNGASIRWAADQILRSDIRSGDIVVWGITTAQRVEFAEEWQLTSNTVANAVREKLQTWVHQNIEYFDTTTHLSLCCQEILHVMNFCEKIGVELYLVNLLNIELIPVVFKDYKNFIDLTDDLPITETLEYLDLGTDRLHPGPKQHKMYADRIFNLITKNRLDT